VWNDKEGYRINGEAEYFDSGLWRDRVREIPENKELLCKGAIVISIKEIRRMAG
jgi:hypothetical protein